ncbi:Uncharacterised protein [Vibrio cholerae]|nr:Uncharacterised protein [Vibrio cholerae]
MGKGTLSFLFIIIFLMRAFRRRHDPTDLNRKDNYHCKIVKLIKSEITNLTY